MIESETREIPGNVEVRCPQCGQISKRIDIIKSIYECPNCLLQFEAVIEVSWDSKRYSRAKR